jgi:hypothetical protein
MRLSSSSSYLTIRTVVRGDGMRIIDNRHIEYDVDLPYSWDMEQFVGKTIKILKFATSFEGFPVIYFECEGKIYRCFLIPSYPYPV